MAKIGLKQNYNQTEYYDLINRFGALAFIPKDRLDEAFKIIERLKPNDPKSVIRSHQSIFLLIKFLKTLHSTTNAISTSSCWSSYYFIHSSWGRGPACIICARLSLYHYFLVFRMIHNWIFFYGEITPRKFPFVKPAELWRGSFDVAHGIRRDIWVHISRMSQVLIMWRSSIDP